MSSLFGSGGSTLYIVLAIAAAVVLLVMVLLRRSRRPQRWEEEEEDAGLTRWASSTLMPDDAEAPPPPPAGPHFATMNDLGRIDRRVDQVLLSLRKKMPAFDLDEKSVQFLSDMLTAQRPHIPPEDWEKFSPHYGAYLGKAILANYRYLEGRWARDNGEWVLVFKVRGQYQTLAPVTQVRQHLEYGEEFSLHRCFKGVHQLFRQ